MNATPHTLAALMVAAFTTGERKSEDTGRMIRVLPHEGQPGYVEWMRDACRAAHEDSDGDSMMPDDWRYEMIEEAAGIIADTTDEDEAHERMDEADAPVYNSELARWLASHSWRASYCDTAAEDHGAEDVNVMQRLSLGWLYEFQNTFHALYGFLVDEAEGQNEAAEESATA